MVINGWPSAVKSGIDELTARLTNSRSALHKL